MAEAGVLPEEFDLKRKIQAAKDELKTATGDADRKTIMAKLADLEMRLAIAIDARRKFLKP